MPREDIDVRLRRGDRLLMDGGTGSEIQRRGISIARGWDTEGDINSWSARALCEAPNVVRAVHEDYLKAGADVIITNSFWANRTRMGMDGMADRSAEYTRLAGEIAVAAARRGQPSRLRRRRHRAAAERGPAKRPRAGGAGQVARRSRASTSCSRST